MEKESIQESCSTLWEETRITREISEGAIYQNLDEAAQRALAEITDIKEKVTGALRHPKPLDICMPVFDAVLAAQYYDLFEMLNLPRSLTVYEPCAGASNPVILAAEAYSTGKAEYTAINLNRNLRGQLQRKIAHLRMNVRIIEDHAQKAAHYLAPGSIDIACFHHAVNDILQTAVSELRGMDTANIDWFSCERQMIEWLAEDAKAGRLDQRGKPGLMQIVGDAVNLVRPGGFLIFDHYNWRKFMGVPWFPWDLFFNLIPMTRQWIEESGLSVVEVRLEGVDPQWWLILQVI
jgi:hypothetical protein